ncbi:MAG: hypothetical protein EPN48_17675 [Microbacteriaceae bacterium]|nr:MAG: hypothetical protein EPN48_17675 [Microbacteriaceae bacterium]
MASEHQTPRTRKTRAKKAQTKSARSQSARSHIAGRLRADSPWIGILGLTSIFQFIRGAPTDGVVFLGASLLLVLDALGLLRFAHAVRTPRTIVTYSVGVFVVALLALLPRYGLADGVIVVGVGITLIPFAWSDPAAPTSADRPRHGSARDGGAKDTPFPAVRRAAILWSGLAIALCLWEVGSFFLGMPSPAATYAHPALSDLIDPLLNNPLGLAAGAAVWILGGAALMRRGRPR